MRYLILAILAGAIVLALLVAPQLQQRLDDSNAYQRQVQALDLAHRDLDLQQYQATLPARVSSDYAFTYLAIALGAVAILILIDGYRQRRAPLVRFGGELVARDLLAQADPQLLSLLADKMRAGGIAQIEAARQPNVPAQLTYAPHFSQRNTDLALPDHTPALASGATPTFGALLDQAKIGISADGRALPLILGYGPEGAIEGSWRDLYSAGVGSLQGAGKTWLQAFLLSQSALAGGRLVICDPHAGHDSESLASRIAALAPAFLCDVAQTDKEIVSALRLANSELEARKAGRGSSYPIVVCVDEWTSLLRGELGNLLPEIATNFAEQGRKFNVNALLSAQGWTKDASGIVRNRLTSHYVLRQRPDEARYQLGLRASQMPEDIRTLPDATGYLLTVRGELVKVEIPRMTAADVARVGTMLGAEPSEVPYNVPSSRGGSFGFGRLAEGTRKASPQGTEGTPGAEKPAPEDARIVALFLAGKSIPEIVQEVFGLGSNAGRAYMEKRAEVEATIRRRLARAA